MHGWLQGLSSGLGLGLTAAQAHMDIGTRESQEGRGILLRSQFDPVAAEMLPWAQQDCHWRAPGK